jgi:hypothetical protein
MPRQRPPIDEDMVALTIRVPRAVLEAVRALAIRERRSVNNQIVVLLEKGTADAS